jgi:tetratricopeptide (TPR) repeat protein
LEGDEDDVVFVEDAADDAPQPVVVAHDAPLAHVAELPRSDTLEPAAYTLERTSDPYETAPFVLVQPEVASTAAPASIADDPEVTEVATFAHAASHRSAWPSVSEPLREALDEIEFYLSQGMSDEAQSMLYEALSAFPEHPALLARQRLLLPHDEPTPPLSAAAPPVLDTAPAAQPIPAAALTAREDRSFELAQKLAEEIVSPPLNNAAVDITDVLLQLKRGIAQQVDVTDAATHYDLGIAYMEMGLHGEAVEEFELCLVDPERKCTAHTLIGLCYVADGDIARGLEYLELARHESPRPEEELGLWFELGNAYELLGQRAEALHWYEQVHARDPRFRDVAARVDRLAIARTPEQEAAEFDAMFDSMILKD